MANYETKSEESLKALKHPVAPQDRKEGIAFIDVDPQSPSYGSVVKDLPLPADLVAHHIFYNRDSSKAYVTALGKGELRVIDMADGEMPINTIAVPDCQVGEDVVFSEDNATWYLTCMGSHKVIVGDARTDEPLKSIDVPNYPHGIAIHNGIDRILVTSTVRASDLGDPGDTITAIEASTGKVLGSYTVSKKPSPAGEAPVEILFVPGTNPPIAYVTNMYGGSLWTATWDPGKGDFVVAEAFDFASLSVGVPLEIYFSPSADRLYVTTAKPGHLHIFDLSQDAAHPKLLKSLPTAEGAHHVAFTKDWQYAFVQNTLLNLPGMSDGSITVVDLQKEEVIGSVDTLKNQGFNPNSIVLLPQWNHSAGH
ncbi:MAG TPA: YncE family protein [Alphaproteobacteria bacterium]|nr:YncE family protein [Alphaproteobacteria bacterium]